MKIKSVFKIIAAAILIWLVSDIVVLGLLPKLIALIASILGFELVKTDLLTGYLMQILVRAIGCALFFVVLQKMGILKKLTAKITWQTVAISWMFFVYIIFNIEYAGFNSPSWYLVLALVVDGLLIGLYEEIVFRGVLLNYCLEKWGSTQKGVFASVVFSSAVFGVFHLTNLFDGASLVSVLTQVVYATMIGVVFSALFLRSNKNLIWCALLHGLYDIAAHIDDLGPVVSTSSTGASSPSVLAYLINLLLFVPILLYGLFLLKKVKPESKTTLLQN